MEVKTVITGLVIGFILFEVIEHVVLPIVFYFMKRKQKSVTGIESFPGEVVEVRQWNETEGQVIVRGELWKAVSDAPFMKGDKAIIQSVKGFTVKINPVSAAPGRTRRKS